MKATAGTATPHPKIDFRRGSPRNRVTIDYSVAPLGSGTPGRGRPAPETWSVSWSLRPMHPAVVPVVAGRWCGSPWRESYGWIDRRAAGCRPGSEVPRPSSQYLASHIYYCRNPCCHVRSGEDATFEKVSYRTLSHTPLGGRRHPVMPTCEAVGIGGRPPRWGRCYSVVGPRLVAAKTRPDGLASTKACLALPLLHPHCGTPLGSRTEDTVAESVPHVNR